MTSKPTEPTTDPPDGVVDRLKGERDGFKQGQSDAEARAAGLERIMEIQSHFASSDPKRDNLGLAKQAAISIGAVENPVEAADAWLANMSGLLQPATVPTPDPTIDPTTPATPEVPVPPVVPMGSGPVPAAPGAEPDQGPFPVYDHQEGKYSAKFNEYVTQHGMTAMHQAIRDGDFFFSTENLEAQETAYRL